MYPLLIAVLLQVRWLVSTTGGIALDGAWRIHAGDEVAYARASFDDSEWGTDTVPGPLRALAPAGGFIWYRGHYALERTIAEPLAIQVSAIGLAFEVYVDGERLGGAGGFPPDYRPRTGLPAVYALRIQSLSPGTHLVAIRAYSLESPPGSLQAVIVAPLVRLMARSHRDDVYMLATAVLLVGLAVYQIFFWARRREAHEHLSIFLFCVFLALFFVTWMPSVRLAISPAVDWFRLYVAFGAAAVTALALGARSIFDVEAGSLPARAAGALGVYFGILVPLVLFLPEWTMVHWLERYLYNTGLLAAGLVLIALAVSARRRGLPQATTLLWGSIALVLTILHDVALAWGALPRWGGTSIVLQFGAVAFVLGIAVATAGKFADTQTTALYDRLTGLYRREVVMDALAREIRRAARGQQPIVVIMMDIDHFKMVNDSFGHLGGDRILAEVGRRLGEAGRAVDWLGRYGGDEFLAVLAVTQGSGGGQAAERFRAAVSALPIEAGRASRTVTLSAGIAAYDGGEEWPTAEQLVGAADAALYRAKNGGRNRASE
jgi:diguanylate cyclase (GGDEF)-like protein